MKTSKIIMMTMLITNLSFSQEFEDSPFGASQAYSRPSYIDTLSPEEALWALSQLEEPYIHAQDIGIKWIRPSLLYWNVVQPTSEHINNGLYDWAVVDNLYGRTPSGANVFGEICNGGLGIKPGTWEFINEEIEERYIQFVKEVVERYDGDGYKDMPGLINPIKYWKIENEASSFYGERLDWQGFSHLVEITYQAIKESSAEAKISIDILVYNPTPPEDPVYPDVQEIIIFYTHVLEELQSKYIDVFDLHIYGVGDRLDGWSWKEMKDMYILTRQKLDQNGYGNAEIWFTETAIPSEPFGERTQAAHLVRRFIYPLSFGAKKVFWWLMIDVGGSSEDDATSRMGLVYNGKGQNDPGYGTKKLAYYTYKKMVEILEGSDWDNVEIIQEEDGIYIYKFTKQGKPIYVAWWEWFADSTYAEGDTVMVTLEVGDMDSVRITEAIPNTESGADLDEEDYPTFFTTVTKQVVDGTVTITLDKNPVFVEGLSFTTSVEEETSSHIPKDFYLEQNYPNPFNPVTTIRYDVPEQSHVLITIYDILGRQIRTILDRVEEPGFKSVVWDGKNKSGTIVSSGIYFYQISAKSNNEIFTHTRKMVLLR